MISTCNSEGYVSIFSQRSLPWKNLRSRNPAWNTSESGLKKQRRQPLIIHHNHEVPEKTVEEEGASGAFIKILIGPEDGSQNIVMRKIRVRSGGCTPLHHHPHEHVVKIEKGRGIVVSPDGEEIAVAAGQSLFIGADEMHQFKNPNPDDFEFVCTILNPDR